MVGKNPTVNQEIQNIKSSGKDIMRKIRKKKISK